MNERPKYITLQYPGHIVMRGYMDVAWPDGREEHFEFEDWMTREEIRATIEEMFPGVEPMVLC